MRRPRFRNKVYYAAESEGGDWFVYNSEAQAESHAMNEAEAVAAAVRWNKRRRLGLKGRLRAFFVNRWTRAGVYIVTILLVLRAGTLWAVWGAGAAYVLGVLDTVEDK